MFGAAAMSLSSFCVVSNALRLNFCRLHDASRDKKIKSAIIKDTYCIQILKNNQKWNQERKELL